MGSQRAMGEASIKDLRWQARQGGGNPLPCSIEDDVSACRRSTSFASDMTPLFPLSKMANAARTCSGVAVMFEKNHTNLCILCTKVGDGEAAPMFLIQRTTLVLEEKSRRNGRYQ